MRDLKERLRDIEGFAPPDLWGEISGREQRPLPPTLAPGRRVAAAALALAVAVTGLVFVSRAFRSSTGPAPVGPVPDVSDGPIWALGGGGEAGSLIFAVDPATGRKSPLWSDGRNPDVSGFAVDPRLVGDDYAFSPDGSMVAFSDYVHEGGAADTKVEIFVMSAHGSGLTQVTHDDAYAAFPSWSPDGSAIVYTSYRGADYIPGCLGSTLCPGDLYVIRVDGTGERQLTDGPGDESMPDWSPDGRSIAFRTAAGDSLGTLSAINVDGTGIREITSGPGGFLLHPEWSPDGHEILFLGGRPQERFGVWVVRPDGTGLRELVETHADTTFGRPVWSPTGSQIAYANLATGEPQLWVMNAHGSEPHAVAELPRYGIMPLAWRPLARAAEGGNPLVIEISPPEARDGTFVAPRFHASYRGTKIPLEAIETPGSELEYPSTVASVPLAAGTPIEVHAEGAQAVAVFELQRAPGEYVRHGSCIVPGAIASLPNQPGRFAFFIYVEWEGAQGGMAFTADVEEQGLPQDGEFSPAPGVDAHLLGLAVCEE